MIKTTCGTCAFADFDVKNGGGGLCRQAPPLAGVGWPVVTKADWCGAWLSRVVSDARRSLDERRELQELALIAKVEGLEEVPDG